ncbi:transposase [Streptomyces sp. NPDC047082]|uniref:transposase n=1 Tax=Streptomyces TaxID=1883 RepID=UPI00292F28BD|nr:transposase [Streptomyces sp. NEAU-HV9]
MFLLPVYSPGLNPVEGVWRSLGNLTLDRLETLVRHRLKRLLHRSEILDRLITGTSLALDAPTSL